MRPVLSVALLLTLLVTSTHRVIAQQADLRPHLAIYEGGSIGALLQNAGDGTVAVWFSVDGAFVGFVPAAPLVVNEPFWQRFPRGRIPADVPVLLMTREAAPPSLISADPQIAPDLFVREPRSARIVDAHKTGWTYEDDSVVPAFTTCEEGTRPEGGWRDGEAVTVYGRGIRQCQGWMLVLDQWGAYVWVDDAYLEYYSE